MTKPSKRPISTASFRRLALKAGVLRNTGSVPATLRDLFMARLRRLVLNADRYSKERGRKHIALQDANCALQREGVVVV